MCSNIVVYKVFWYRFPYPGAPSTTLEATEEWRSLRKGTATSSSLPRALTRGALREGMSRYQLTAASSKPRRSTSAPYQTGTPWAGSSSPGRSSSGPRRGLTIIFPRHTPGRRKETATGLCLPCVCDGFPYPTTPRPSRASASPTSRSRVGRTWASRQSTLTALARVAGRKRNRTSSTPSQLWTTSSNLL